MIDREQELSSYSCRRTELESKPYGFQEGLFDGCDDLKVED